MNFSVTELKFLLEKMSLLIILLAGLLLVLSVAIYYLGRLTHTKTTQTDLDLIGQQAKVTRAIKPPHAGKISGRHNGKSFTLQATSSQLIKSGQIVLITALDQGVARTIIQESGVKS